MKNTIVKILGVVLTFAVLAGLLLAAMPTTVAAGSVAWSVSTTPWLTQGTNPGKVVFANSGSTMYVVVAGAQTVANIPSISGTTSTTGTTSDLFSSADGGKTWSRTNLDTDFTLATSGATSIKVASDNESMLAYNASGIWRSVNAGQNWYSVTVPVSGTLGTNVKITSADQVIDSNNGIEVLVGYRRLNGSLVARAAWPSMFS